MQIMSGLNLGLAAADAYYRADDARVLREQRERRFGDDLYYLFVPGQRAL